MMMEFSLTIPSDEMLRITKNFIKQKFPTFRCKDEPYISSSFLTLTDEPEPMVVSEAAPKETAPEEAAPEEAAQ